MKEQINELLQKIGLKAVEVKLEQVTIGEGEATLEAEKFEVGEPVFIVNEDERIAVPVGEYKLDNGFMLVVSEEGIIGEYKEMEAEKEEEAPEVEEEQEVAASDKPAETALPKSIIESVTKETKFSAQDELIKSLEAKVTELKAQVEALNEPKEEVVELAKPITQNPENAKEVEAFRFSQNKGNSVLDRVFAKMNK